jgi:hypothetical protein
MSEKLRRIVEEFRVDAEYEWDLTDPREAKNRCEIVSAMFADYVDSEGLPMDGIVQLLFRYLGEDIVAFIHRANLIDGRIYDWTMNQFVDAPLPAVFDDIHTWVEVIDRSLRGRYEYPDVEILAYGCPFYVKPSRR